MSNETVTDVPIELVGGRHDGIKLSVDSARDKIKYQGVYYSDTNQVSKGGRLIFRCSSKEGRLKQSFFERGEAV